MASPYFNFGFEEDPQSRFLDLYSRFASSPGTDFSQFLDPSDPDLQAYQKRAIEPTGSEELISEYVGRRPTYEDYKPGLGRKLAAFAIGALSGNPNTAYSLAQKHLYDPFERAEADWKSEGTGITARARLIDAERQRELAGMKYGLTTKAAGLRAGAQDEARRRSQSAALAGKVQGEEDRNLAREDRLNAQKFRQDMSQQIFEFRQQQENWNKEQDVIRNTRLEEEDKARNEAKAAEATDLGKVNKKLFDYASQQGIDHSDYGSALEVAQALAFERALANPAFKDLIVKDPESEVPYSIAEPKYGTDRIRILNNYLKMMTQKYLRGEFQ